MSEINSTTPGAEFTHMVGEALSQLYDSVYLQSHPLGKVLFPAEISPLRRGQSLRKLLLDAIHAIEPGAGVPGGAPDRRLYRLIELRYIEGLDPNEAMAQLCLAKSQFYRDQARAVEMLAWALWPHVQQLAPDTMPEGQPRTQLIHTELERLSPARETEGINAPGLMDDLRQIIQPLVEERGLQLARFELDALHEMPLDRILLRQALLSALLAALDVPELQELSMTSEVNVSSCAVTITATTNTENIAETIIAPPALLEQLETCRMLAEALGMRLSAAFMAKQAVFTLARPEAQRKVLLVIDDNTGMADLFRLYLKGGHWQVLGAGGGREAREILKESRPDLILLDILMPQEDGWDLLRALKTDPASRDIPVIICSVLKQPQVALKLGAAAYVEKPVSRETLWQTLAIF